MSSAALFALGWLFVFVTSLNEAKILEALASDSNDGPFRWMRSLDGMETPPSVAIMMAFWNHPFIILTLAIWAISRGSIAVGGKPATPAPDYQAWRPE